MIFKVDDISKDAKNIAVIEEHCFSTPWSEEQIKKSDSNTTFFIVKIDDKAVGYGGMYTVVDEGYITNIGVLPEYRRKGIGKKIVSKLIDFSIENSLLFLSLEVRKSNIAAIKLYESFEFKPVGERKNFYRFPNEDAIIMTRYFK